MISTAILLVLLAIAAVTDIRSRKIFNWTCYPGILVAFALSAMTTLLGIDETQGGEIQHRLWGTVPIADSLAGFFVCGAAMLVCYLFFAGAVGGGDVKLVAMIGAFLGARAGLEVMLWTFVLAGCQALITLVWKYGFWKIVHRVSSFLWMKI